ncbi:MAG: metallophosphoesterase [Actinomycetota bacterium]|nr:metallophosphoesterase [Actinomycetota bacterium]
MAVGLFAALVACAGSSGPRHGTGASPPPIPPRSPHSGAYGFALIGDFGTQDAAESAVAASMRQWVRRRPFDGLVTLGDNVYDSGSPGDFHAAWTAPYGWVDRLGVPVVWTLGNHDVETADGAPELRAFHVPGRWYERTVGPVEFVVLDANQPDDASQMAWLERTLGAATAPWTVVVFHQPAYSCGFHQSTPEVDARWVPLFARYHVDLVVNGHDHDYQRFAPKSGVTYVVDGEGGADFYPVGPCPAGTPSPVAANDTDHGFLYLSATASRLTGQAVGVGGTVLDTFVLRNR